MGKVKFPFGAADSQSASYAATVTATIDNTMTVLTIGQMTGACTLNLTVSAETMIGSVLLVKTSADGTNRVFTPGTGMTGVAQTNVASKSWNHKYIYDGSTFQHVGSVQTN
jgi:hypothetical protein